tara:strand:+ start:450 stop:665 length:216 start_codon:yes stop_codon:yes gene_type:complete
MSDWEETKKTPKYFKWLIRMKEATRPETLDEWNELGPKTAEELNIMHQHFIGDIREFIQRTTIDISFEELL